MNDDSTSDSVRAAAFADEIRGYLLGRVGAKPITGEIDGKRTIGIDGSLYGSRVLSWWILEGQRFGNHDTALSESWSVIVRQAKTLLKAFSPRQRAIESPDGPVDWIQTIQHRAGTGSLAFVCQASHVGLGEDERRALCGWAGWVAGLWRDYCVNIRTDRDPNEVELLERIAAITTAAPKAPDLALLRRWAHIARRSRWPLLRNVVAESLRSAFDLRQVDRLPLPSSTSDLFELLCLVRVMSALEPRPAAIRWLMNDLDNTVAIPGVTCHFQKSFDKAEVIQSGAFEPEMARAIDQFGIDGLPTRSDIIVRFDSPRQGFDGILIEAKSGGERHKDALLQLHAYGATISSRWGGRWIHWGVIEQESSPIQDEQLAFIRDRAASMDATGLVIFSSAGEIARVLAAAIGTS